jgi:hypothetical protein
MLKKPLISKSFANEEGYDYNNDISINKPSTVICSKTYKYNINNDEDIKLVKNEQFSKSIHVHDFRLFDSKIHNDMIYLLVFNKKANQNILKLFSELDVIIRNVEVDNNNSYTLDNEQTKHFSKNEYEHILEHNLHKCLEEINNSPYNHNNTSTSKKVKIIFYIDFNNSDLEIFYILNFFIKNVDFGIKNNFKIIFLSDENMLIKLGPGMNYIYISENLFTKKGVGLLPVKNSIISTKGLMWDVQDWKTSFGEVNLSTSNEFVDYECTVYVAEGNVFFSAEIDVNKIVNEM